LLKGSASFVIQVIKKGGLVVKKALALGVLIMTVFIIASIFYMEKQREIRAKEVEIVLQEYIEEVKEYGYLRPIAQKKIQIELREIAPNSEISVEGSKKDAEFFESEVFIYAKVEGRFIGVIEILIEGERSAFG